MSRYQPLSSNFRNNVISVVRPTKRGRLLIILVLLLSLVGTICNQRSGRYHPDHLHGNGTPGPADSHFDLGQHRPQRGHHALLRVRHDVQGCTRADDPR